MPLLTSTNHHQKTQSSQVFVTSSRKGNPKLISLIKPQLEQSKLLDLYNKGDELFLNSKFGGHSCQRLPLALSPSFAYKFTSPVRTDFLKYLAKNPELNRDNQSIVLENYAKLNKLNYRESNNRETRTLVRQLHVGFPSIGFKQSYQKKTNLRYLLLDDSGIQTDEVDKVMNSKNHVKPTKLDDIPLDLIFRGQEKKGRKQKSLFRINTNIDLKPDDETITSFNNIFISQSQKVATNVQ